MNIDIETVTEVKIHLPTEEQFERRDSLDRLMTVREIRVTMRDGGGSTSVQMTGRAISPTTNSHVGSVSNWDSLDILPPHVLTALSAALEERNA